MLSEPSARGDVSAEEFLDFSYFTIDRFWQEELSQREGTGDESSCTISRVNDFLVACFLAEYVLDCNLDFGE